MQKPNVEPFTQNLATLPFENLDPLRFEDLCRDLASQCFKRTFGKHGTEGAPDNGIDVITLDSGPCIGIQCKRTKTLKVSDIERIVHKALSKDKGGLLADKDAPTFILATACNLENTQLIEQWMKMHLQYPQVSFDLWGKIQLEMKLQTQIEIVEKYFGNAREFCLEVSENKTRNHDVPIEEWLNNDFVSIVTKWNVDGKDASNLAINFRGYVDQLMYDNRDYKMVAFGYSETDMNQAQITGIYNRLFSADIAVYKEELFSQRAIDESKRARSLVRSDACLHLLACYKGQEQDKNTWNVIYLLFVEYERNRYLRYHHIFEHGMAFREDECIDLKGATDPLECYKKLFDKDSVPDGMKKMIMGFVYLAELQEWFRSRCTTCLHFTPGRTYGLKHVFQRYGEKYGFNGYMQDEVFCAYLAAFNGVKFRKYGDSFQVNVRVLSERPTTDINKSDAPRGSAAPGETSEDTQQCVAF